MAENRTPLTDSPSVAHTPTPWQACHEGKCPCRQVWSIAGDVPVFTAAADPRCVVGIAHGKWGDGPDLIYGEIPPAEQQANAEFIVRAVNCHQDLLDACKHAVERNCGCHSSEGRGWHSDKCSVPILRAAIKKAESGG